jgi:hypothetical protein
MLVSLLLLGAARPSLSGLEAPVLEKERRDGQLGGGQSAELAYGDRELSLPGKSIAAGSVLVIEVELVQVRPRAAATRPPPLCLDTRLRAQGLRLALPCPRLPPPASDNHVSPRGGLGALV